MKKVLFICNDTVGFKMAGPAIRCTELARALSAHFDVVVSAKKLDKEFNPGFRIVEATASVVEKEANTSDIIIFQGNGLENNPNIKNTSAVLIADMYCPIPLEYQMSSFGSAENIRLAIGWNLSLMLLDQIRIADYFICASQRQIDFWTGALTLTGRVNALSMPTPELSTVDRFFGCVPFGLSDDAPTNNGRPLREKFNIPENDFLMVWGGGVYEWFDPVTIIRAIGKLDIEGLSVHLVFMGVKHPNPNLEQHDKLRDAVEIAQNLGLLNRLVHFNFGWIEYSVRHEYLLDADVGVSSHLNNIETRYSFRTRILDYIWCNLPMITTKGDEFGEMVRTEKLGISVDYEDVNGWCDAIRMLSSDKVFYHQCKKNVESIRDQYKWSEVAKPLIRACYMLTQSGDKNYIIDKVRNISSGNSGAIFIRLISYYKKHGLMGVLKKTYTKIISKF